VCVLVCVCVHARMHARTHACTHACMHACTHACTHACMARMHARMHACTHARMHACTHARTHARAHACAPRTRAMPQTHVRSARTSHTLNMIQLKLRTHIHTHLHTNTHTHIPLFLSSYPLSPARPPLLFLSKRQVKWDSIYILSKRRSQDGKSRGGGGGLTCLSKEASQMRHVRHDSFIRET